MFSYVIVFFVYTLTTLTRTFDFNGLMKVRVNIFESNFSATVVLLELIIKLSRTNTNFLKIRVRVKRTCKVRVVRLSNCSVESGILREDTHAKRKINIHSLELFSPLIPTIYSPNATRCPE